MGKHWHVGTGLAGYGTEDPGPPLTLEQACAAVSYEAGSLADFSQEGYYALRDSEMWEDACKAIDDAEKFEVLRHNTDFSEHGRGRAPLFAGEDGPYKLNQSMLHALTPGVWDYDMGRCRLYAWECGEECEWDEED